MYEIINRVLNTLLLFIGIAVATPILILGFKMIITMWIWVIGFAPWEDL